MSDVPLSFHEIAYYFSQLAHMLLPKILAAGGLLFAFEHSTVAGKIVLALSRHRLDLQLVDHDHEAAGGSVCAKTERAFSRRLSQGSATAALV